MTADAFDRPASVLLLGGTSEIGLAITRRLVAEGATRVVLAGRNDDALADAGAALGPAAVEVVAFDATDTAGHERMLDQAFSGGDIDLVIAAFGQLGDPAELEAQPDSAVSLAQVNYVGWVSAGLRVGQRLADQGHGTIVVLSSVAGERVRRSNFVYGSTKAAQDTFSQGLGDALRGKGVRVLIVRPGFVHTKMTAGRKPPPLSTTADAVADAVLRALNRRAEMIWVPPALRWLMRVLRILPRVVFRRLPI
jgi:decaprenylphospho-beta-D-erythro-pentofuranosid-2-ulose 2-reductase